MGEEIKIYKSWIDSGLLEGLEEIEGIALAKILDALAIYLVEKEDEYLARTKDNCFAVFRRVFCLLLKKGFDLKKINDVFDSNLILDEIEKLPLYEGENSSCSSVDPDAEIFASCSNGIAEKLLKDAF